MTKKKAKKRIRKPKRQSEHARFKRAAAKVYKEPRVVGDDLNLTTKQADTILRAAVFVGVVLIAVAAFYFHGHPAPINP